MDDAECNEVAQSVIVIGATGCIGTAIMHRFAAPPWDLIAVSRGRLPLIKLPSRALEAITGDITDVDFVKELGGVLERRARVPRVLVHCAGCYCGVLPPSATDELMIHRTNFESVRQTLDVFAPLMGRNGGGRIVLIGSISAWRGSRCEPYARSKAALLTMMRERCSDYATREITLNTLLPGPVESPFFRASCDATRRAQYLDDIPMHRYAKPDEIAGTVAFLASPDASYITGAAIPISGGLI